MIKIKNAMKRTLIGVGLLASVGLVAGCSSDADVASRNLSQAADQFEINRRIVFYNGITGEYILEVVGLCSIGNSGRFSITCKSGPNEYRKHYLGLSDNVTYFAEQLGGADVSAYHYRVIFKPQSILPDVDFIGDAGALIDLIPDGS